MFLPRRIIAVAAVYAAFLGGGACVVGTQPMPGQPGAPGEEGPPGPKGDQGEPGLPGDPAWEQEDGLIFYLNGRVGIGNSDPYALLTVGSATPGEGEPQIHGSIQLDGGHPAYPGGLEFKASPSALGYGWRIINPDLGAQDTPLIFQARNNSSDWTEVLRVDAIEGQNPLLTAPFIATPALGFNAGGSIANSSNGAPENIGIYAGGAERVTVADGGSVGIGTTTPISKLEVKGGCITGSFCSDVRLKHDIVPLSPESRMLEKVLSLQPVTYAWNGDPTERRQLGLVAQDVGKVIPEAVTDGEQLGLSCTSIDAAMVQAMKEQDAVIRKQQRIIVAHQDAITRLSNRLARLEALVTTSGATAGK